MNINTENTTLSYPEIIKCQQAFRNYKLCLIDKTKSAVLSYSKSIKTPQQRLDKFRCAIDINNLRITCSNKITDIDPIVFAYFVLFKQETPQLKSQLFLMGEQHQISLVF